MTIWAKVSTQYEGFHKWPQAPDEVDFLRNLHRHMFHVTVFVEQMHAERDVEYILLKRLVDKFLSNLHEVPGVENFSCETIASYLVGYLKGEYHPARRRIMCEVLEDGENGAFVEL